MIKKGEILEEFKTYMDDVDDPGDKKMLYDIAALVSRYVPQKDHVNRPMAEEELEEAIRIVNEYAKKFKSISDCWPLFEAHEYFKTQLEFLKTQSKKEAKKMWT